MTPGVLLVKIVIDVLVLVLRPLLGMPSTSGAPASCWLVPA